jgi:hypothetical protein
VTTDTTVVAPSPTEAVTPESLTRVLRRAGGIERASVVSVQAEPLGRGMAGRIARLTVSYDRPEPGAPSTVVMKLPSSHASTRALGDRLRIYQREERFYREIAQNVPVRVPRAWLADSGPPDFALLLEDATDARPGDLLRGCSPAEATAVLAEIARLHAVWWESRALDAESWLPAPNDDIVMSLMQAHGGGAWATFERKFGAHMGAEIARLGRWLATDRTVLDRLSAPPRTLVHGDLRANNVLFGAGGDVRALIDWQTAVQGRGAIDVANFFVSSLTPPDRRAAEVELLPYYHGLLVEHGVRGYSLDQCREDYRLAVANQFAQVVVLSSLLEVDDRLDDGVGSVTGGRLIGALLELRAADLAPTPARRAPALARALRRIHRRLTAR